MKNLSYFSFDSLWALYETHGTFEFRAYIPTNLDKKRNKIRFLTIEKASYSWITPLYSGKVGNLSVSKQCEIIRDLYELNLGKCGTKIIESLFTILTLAR